MARTSRKVEIGKRKLELSNLEKVLYPDDGVLKAEIVQYYLKIAPTILNHIKGRPLSMIRYPDGIYGEQFFQKNMPEWTPEWIETVELGQGRVKNYVVATEPATLVWLANLACLELHNVHARKPNLDKPDYFVVDLDPPEETPFTSIIDIALRLKDHLDGLGYVPFVKTSGKKGLHVVVPIEPKWDFDEVFKTAKTAVEPFVKRNKDTTLHIKKESRKGRVLLDIYRNRPSQTIVSAYSLRGAKGAPVSMPLSWTELEGLNDPSQYTIQNVVDQVLSEGDVWEAMNAYATPLHTKRKASESLHLEVEPSEHYKMPEQLQKYADKRNFQSTPEPRPLLAIGNDDTFVVHRHHASRLHYDLRLEQDGVLKSWAVPRGMPPHPGVKRLAVATEDHPMEYLSFEGTIPKGQYGGGDMWRFAMGRYDITKEKKDGFYFRLASPEMNAEYRIYNTKGKDWLLERVDEPQTKWLTDPIDFTLMKTAKEVPRGEDFIYELKWDGIRAMIVLDEGKITIRSRNQKDITAKFPELQIPEEAFRAYSGVFDSEIVCLDPDGRANFTDVIRRIQQSTEGGIKRLSQRKPAYCYLFDCLHLDGRAIINEPLIRRREWLKDSVKRGTRYRVTDVVTEGEALFEATKKMSLEGIVAKDRTSKYHPGKRTDAWMKVMHRTAIDCVILGYTPGKGDRKSEFGSLHVGVRDNDELLYRGRVGTGFNATMMKLVMTALKDVKEVEKYIPGKVEEEAKTTWVEPRLHCEVEYGSVTKENQTFRHASFIKLRPDLDA